MFEVHLSYVMCDFIAGEYCNSVVYAIGWQAKLTSVISVPVKIVS
jgi:hypothetical protein